MARRRSFRRTRTVYRRAAPYVRRARGGGGAMKPIIDGVMAGVGGQLATKYIGAYGHPAATLAIGMFRNNTTLKTEGARELGIALASQLPFIGGGGSQGTAGAFE